MTYVVRVWEKPIDWPIATTFDQALAQLDRLDQLPELPSAKLSLFGQRLQARFPYHPDSHAPATWHDEPIDRGATGPVWNIGIAERDRLDEVQAVLVTEAVAMGLNVLDEQAGEIHLGNGAVHAVPGNEARAACVRGLAARILGDLSTARAEFRRLTLQGNRYAQVQWAQMLLIGHGDRKDPACGLALILAAQGWGPDGEGGVRPPADAGARASGEDLRRRLGAERTNNADRLLRKSGTIQELVRRIDEIGLIAREIAPQLRRAAESRPRLRKGEQGQTSVDLQRAGATLPIQASAGAPRTSRMRDPVEPVARHVPVVFGPGHWCLVAALLLVLPVLTFPESRRLLWTLWLSSAALGAFGAWRVGVDLEWSVPKRLAFIVGIAFLPTAVFVLPGALWSSLKGRPR
jgi:hypothetical protein